MSDFKSIIENAMTTYAGAVIQSRALVDVRDGLKPSARQIFYSMLQHKLTHDKPHKKTMNAVGMSMADYYLHGDSSCEGIIMRASQPWAMRYPLIDVRGNNGSLLESGNWAAPRYTESRLSKLAGIMFKDIDKGTLTARDWKDNYDNTKQYPAVLPTKGFYNIVNGAMGIAVGMACSIPQYNLKELNNALIYLIDHPDCDFEDIYCAPDFATGAILYNESEVKNSMKNGTGFACKLRSVIEFNSKERCFIVTELPYSVYTNTICEELDKIILDEEHNPGVDTYKDLTGNTPLIKIYLTKRANPDKVLKYLYKNTSLQHYYGINFTMLEDGRYPRVFTWKEMLEAHIEHEAEVYRNGFNYDLTRIEDRLWIIKGLLICLASINEVVKTIKEAASVASASTALQQNFLLDAVQAKAVLDMKLSRLAHLEVQKLKDEQAKLEAEAARIHKILEDKELFNNELKNGWREVARVFGDSRRTQILDLVAKDDSDMPIEKKRLSLTLTNAASVFVSETTTLYSQRRNGVGAKFKLDRGDFIIDNFVGDSTDTVLFFTSTGKYYHAYLGDFVVNERQHLSNFFNLGMNEQVISATILSKDNPARYLIFITKQGKLKKTLLSEYQTKRNVGAIAIQLSAGDEIVAVLPLNDEKIGIAAKNSNFILIETKDIRSIGRTAQGVCGMKLDNTEVVSARIILNNTSEIVSIADDGYIKSTTFSEFHITNRATKGRKLQNTECLCDFLPLTQPSEVLITSSTAQIRLKYTDIPKVGIGAQGAKAMKLQNSKIVGLSLV